MLRHFLTPRKVARHLFVLAIVGGCVWAGLWQLSRLQWQNRFDRTVAARLRAGAVPFDRVVPKGSTADPDAFTYRHVTAIGTYDTGHELIWLARTRSDLNGNDVLTPLLLPDGRALLVDRGWVPFEEQTPPVAAAVPPGGTVMLTGVLFPSEVPAPGKPVASGPAFTKIDLARIGRGLSLPLAPVYLLLQSQAPAQPETLPQPEPLPDLTVSPPHLSYTIQWFVFATIGLLGYPIVLRREARRLRASAP
jgi:cytochrome oxidase assembly protein ShyY1